MKVFIFKLNGTFSFRAWFVRADSYEAAMAKLKTVDHNLSEGVENGIVSMEKIDAEGVLGFTGDEIKNPYDQYGA